MPPKPAVKAPAKAGAKPAGKAPAGKAAAGKAPAGKAPAGKAAAGKGAAGGAAKEPAKPAVVKKVLVPEEIVLKEMANVIQYGGEVGEKLKKSERWPYLIDRQGNAGTFLKYRNVNMISVTSVGDFNAETLRQGLLGGLCFGKPVVVDISDAEQAKILDVVKSRYDEIYSGLWDDILTRKIVDEEKAIKLYVSAVDPDDYKNEMNYRLSEFQFIILTNLDPPSTVMEDFFPIIIS